LIRGTVVDLDGKGLAYLRVREIGEEVDGVVSDEDGAFAIRPTGEPWTLALDEAEWTTVHPATSDDPPSPSGARIVAAKSTVVAGVVVDRRERPLPGAHVELARDGFSWSGSANFEGRFRIQPAPAVAGIRAAASLAGWRTEERTLDLPLAEELRFVLDPEDPDAVEIDGDVVHADASPAANALVVFGSARTRTDSKGKFHLVCDWFDAETPLVAIEKKLEPAVIDGFGARCLPPATPEPAHVVLGGPARTIEGRVVTARGEPCKGFAVHLLGRTALDPTSVAGNSVEDEAAGRSGWSHTDAQGEFLFDGLRDRDYVVLASGERRAPREMILRSDPVPAGTHDLVLRLPSSDDRAPIRGRIRTSGGPVAGARVALGEPVPAGSAGQFAPWGRSVTTGSDGRFELADAPPGFAILVASAEGCLPARFELAADAPRDAVDIPLHARREMRIDLSHASPAPNALRAFDAAGRAIPLWSTRAMPLVWLRKGDPFSIGAGDDTRAIALYRGARELARIPVAAGTGPIEISWP
jgi:hypothetical protein